MDLIFVSGWAGFDKLFPNISTRYEFIIPIYDMDEKGLLNHLASKKADILIGWSTGAHIILKQIEILKENYANILLIAPFFDFMEHTDEKVIDKMISNLQKNPISVVKYFYRQCGIKNIPKIDRIDKEKLSKGLEFLKTSKVKADKLPDNIYVMHGKKDKIVPCCKDRTFKNLTILNDSGHYIDEGLIRKKVYEITNSAIF